MDGDYVLRDERDWRAAADNVRFDGVNPRVIPTARAAGCRTYGAVLAFGRMVSQMVSSLTVCHGVRPNQVAQNRNEALELRNARLEATVRALTAALQHTTVDPQAELLLEPLALPMPMALHLRHRPPLQPVGLGDLEEPEVTLHICGFLCMRELGRLARVSRRFGSPAAGPGTLPLVQEAARRLVAPGDWSRPAEEHMRVAWLRLPPRLSRAPPNIALTEEGTVATVTRVGGFQAAACGSVLRGGRHHARFTPLKRRYNYMLFGVICERWDVEGRGQNAENVEGHCFYHAYEGTRFPGSAGYRGSEWEGMQTAEEGDTIGLTLDLEQGTLTVFKNGEELGVMATGLEGGFVWAVAMGSGQDDSVRVEFVAAPAADVVTDMDMVQ